MSKQQNLDRNELYEETADMLGLTMIEVLDLFDQMLKPKNAPLKYRREKLALNYAILSLVHTVREIFDQIQLSALQNAQLITAGILSRSLVEAMGTVHWLTNSRIFSEMEKNSEILIEKAGEIDEMYLGNISRLSELPIKNKAKLESFGEGILTYYSHTSSFAHVDTAYYSHFSNNEVDGMANYISYMSLACASNIAWMLNEAYYKKKRYSKILVQVKKRTYEESIKIAKKHHPDLVDELDDVVGPSGAFCY